MAEITINSVLSMARKAGAVGAANAYKSHILYGDWAIENFAALIRADEREACAKICDEVDKESQSQWPKRLATMIRARDKE
jgi:hypothetical protein